MALETINIWSQGGSRYLSEAAGGATPDAPLGAQYLAERLGGGGSLISVRERRGLNISHARLDQGGRVLWPRRRQKEAVGANCEEV